MWLVRFRRVELVVDVDNPGTGVWTIEVHGVAVPFPVPRFAPALRQDFAVAISNADFA